MGLKQLLHKLGRSAPIIAMVRHLCNVSHCLIDSLGDVVCRNINSALRRVGDEMSPRDMANCAYGFALLAFDTLNPFDVAFRGVHEALLSIIKRNFAQKSFAPSSIVDGNLTNENYSSSRHYVSDDEIDLLEMMNKVTFASKRYNDIQEVEQLRIFCHYVQVFNRISDNRDIPKSLLQFQPPSNNSTANSFRSSKLQSNLIDCLKASFDSDLFSHQYDVMSEYSSFNGAFPVDAAVFHKDRLIALIEIDGPHHYRSDGTIRRKDKLKETMYKAGNADCLFHRIRWDEANKLGAEAISMEVADLIDLHYRSMSAMTSLFRKSERAFANFFSWGLRNDL